MSPENSAHVDGDERAPWILFEIAQQPLLACPFERVGEMLFEERFGLFPGVQLVELVFRAEQGEGERSVLWSVGGQRH